MMKMKLMRKKINIKMATMKLNPLKMTCIRQFSKVIKKNLIISRALNIMDKIKIKIRKKAF